MSDVVVESMAAGDTMHVAHSSAHGALVFAVVCALSAMAEPRAASARPERLGETRG